MRAVPLLLCLSALPAWAGLGEASAREVGDDYQVDYLRTKGSTLQIVGPAGASVEILEGLKTVASGTAPFTFRPSKPGVFIVSLHTRGVAHWETHVSTRAGTRAMLRAWPGRVRTQLTVVAPPSAESQALASSDFDALKSRVGQTSLKKLPELQAAAAEARFSAYQAGELLDLFSDSRERLKALGWLRHRLVDPDNAIGLSGRFTLLADRRRAQTVLGN